MSNLYLMMRQTHINLTLNNIVSLKSGLRVTQGHLKWYHSKAWIRFPIRNP